MAAVENQMLALVELPEVLQPGNLGAKVELVSNLSRIEIDPSRVYYQYHVKVNEKYSVNGEERVRILSEEVLKNDFLDQRHKRAVVTIFKKMVSEFPNHFNGAFYQIYDRESILFSLNEIDAAAEAPLVININPAGIADLDEHVTTIEVVLKPARHYDDQTPIRVSGSAISSAAGIGENKAILEVMNLAVSQKPFFEPDRFRSYRNGCHYLVQQPGRSEGFMDSDFPELKDGKKVAVGLSESVKVLGEGVPFVVTDVKKSAFHKENIPLWDKIIAMFDKFNPVSPTAEQLSVIERQLKGVFVTTTYTTKTDRRQNIRISGLGGNCLTTQVDIGEGKLITLEVYYKTRYGITLLHPECFTVIGKPGCLYPIELLLVGPAQRVSVPQQTPAMISTLIKASAMKPADRLRQTMRMKDMVGLNTQSANLRTYGLNVSDQLQSIVGRVLPTPKVLFAQDATAPVKDNCKWTFSAKFVEAMTVPPWAVVALCAGRDDSLAPTMNDFVTRFRGRCVSHGMTVPDPSGFWSFKEPTSRTIAEVFAEAVRKGLSFLFFLSSDRVVLHDHIKFHEVRNQLVTQELRLTCVRNVVEKNQNMTLDNIVAKTNLKLGGLNHIVRLGNGANDSWIHSPDRLIIGFDIMNPAKVASFEMASNEDPWVLGWSANCSSHPLKFVGDYIYVRARDSESATTTLTTVTEEILKRFYENRNVVPKHIYVYFNGVSEGQWKTIATTYKDAMKIGITKMYTMVHDPAKFVLLVCSKSHNERIYKKVISGTNSAAQNIAPGTVVDSTITSSIAPEFYLNAHSAFQGTAKTPKYTVLADENEKKMPLNAHESIAHALCYLHEIIAMTVSVPAPLLVADRCAKRGHAVYKIAREELGRGTPLTTDQANEELTNHCNALNTNGRSLVNKRFNA